MAKSSSSISGVAERYAGSLFDLAVEAKTVGDVESDLTRFEALLREFLDEHLGPRPLVEGDA